MVATGPCARGSAAGGQESTLRARGARAHLESDVEQGLRAERVLGYIRDGEISRAMRLLHSQGIAGLTPGVLTQLRAKHPERQHTVPTVLPAMQHAAPSVSLRETFRTLRRRAGTGMSGRRNEYLRCLARTFDDAMADRVIPAYDDFASSMVRVEFPSWFYSALAIAGLVPLVKARLTPEQVMARRDPDVRPVAIGEVEVRAVGRAMAADAAEDFADTLAPQQLAVGIPGGISVLIFGTRCMLEMRPRFVVVRLDLRNG